MDKIFIVTYEGYDGKMNDFITYVIGAFKTIESAGKVIDEAKALRRSDDRVTIFYEEWSMNKYYKVRYWSDRNDPSNDDLCEYEQDTYMVYEQELAE